MILMMEKPVPYPSRSGFTLIELSIVLVIVGLIVGGVLVGRDLIKAAEIRATVGQVERYNSAVNTFRIKYNGLPGDLASANASQFGMAARAGSLCQGDGNGLLQDLNRCLGNTPFPNAGNEITIFWSDLAFANLIDGSFTFATDAPTTVASGSQSTVFPPAKLGDGNYFTVFSENGLNYYALAGINSTNVKGSYSLSNNISPAEAVAMDSKLDDGFPLTGSVLAADGPTAVNIVALPGAATCVFTGGTQYNTTTQTLANTNLCHLRIRMQ